MNQGSVLVLDDNRDQAQRLSVMLSQQKWTSVLSFDQKMALKLLKSSRFHLLMFEAYVGGESTLQIVEQIRGQAHDAPLAIMSAEDPRFSKKGNSTSNLARIAGADFVINKPFTPDKLKTLLADTHSYHRARMKEHHVLVVEDDRQLAREVCAVLKQVGYRVSWAANMEDALFDHNLGLVDVVLTAVLIPGIGGIEGTAQIKKDWPHIQVIATSEGVDDKITALHVLSAAKAAGADVLLPKPFTMHDMLRAVASVIRTKGSDAELPANADQAAVDALFG